MLNSAQKKASKQLKKRLRKYGIGLLWGQIRAGKTRPFLTASKGYKTLVITKLDAIKGVLSEATEIGIEVDVINYHSVQCLIEGEAVAQTNLKGDLNFVNPVRNICKDYDGELLTHTSSNGFGISITATPNHRQPIINTVGRDVTKLYKDLGGNFKIPCGLGTPKNKHNLTQHEKQLICYQADGSNHNAKRGLFTFSKQRKIDRFLQIFPNASEVIPSTKSSINVKDTRRFTTTVKNKSKKLSDNFKLSEFTKEKAHSFIREVVLWDGHVYSENSLYYSCVDKENVDFVNAVAFLAGFHTYQTLQVDNRKESYQDVHRLYITTRINLSMQKVKHTKESFNGKVYCVQVPTSYIIVKQKGRAFISGNCHLYISQAKPKLSTIWNEVVKFTKGKLCIYASGTPTPETYAGLYHMLALSSWSPFKFQKFTHFFDGFSTWRKPDKTNIARSYNYTPPYNSKLHFVTKTKGYGVPSTTYTGQLEVPCYKLTQVDKLLAKIEHLIVRLKRIDTGHKHEAQDVDHNIKMSKEQKALVRILDIDGLYEKPCGTCKRCLKGKKRCKSIVTILCDTAVKELSKYHQISGGVAVKGEFVDNNMLIFQTLPPKVKYIKKNFDINKTIILSYYVHEQEYLAKMFPHTGSVTKMSTGVDLSHYDTMIIYSMAFSSANYYQVKGRLMNVKRKTPINVHYLLSGRDEYVLGAVRDKKNFTSNWYDARK